MAPAEQRSFVNEYDREVIHLDHWVGVLLDYLERSGLGARTLVILTSDHGEFLGEHQLIGHGKDLYAEVVDVPLIVWEPGATPGRVSRPVQGLDLFPTILRYLGLPIPEGTQGQPLLEADHPTVSEEYYAAHRHAIQPARPALRPHPQDRSASASIATSRAPPARSGSSTVTADPHETHNLIVERPDVAASARARLEAVAAEHAGGATSREPPRQIDAEALENLRALGYIR